MTIHRRPLGIAGLLLATSAWGSLFLVGKPVLAHVNPVWFTCIRYTLASIGFAALLLWRGLAARRAASEVRAGGSIFPWAKLQAHAPRLALLGFAGYGFFSVMVLTGLAHSVPSHGAVVMATMSITTQLVRWAVDGLKPTRAALLGTALALVGVAMVSGVFLGESTGTRPTLAGDLTALLGTLGWIAYTRGAAKLPDLDVLEYSALTAAASWPLLLAAAIAGTVFQWAPPSAHELLGVAMVVSALLIHTLAQQPMAKSAPGVRTSRLQNGTAPCSRVSSAA